MLNNKRELQGTLAIVALVLAALIPLSAVGYALRILPSMGFIIYKEQFLAFFLMLCLALTFMITPAKASQKGQRHIPWYDYLLVAVALGVGGYISLRYHALVGQMGLITVDKVVVSAAGILMLLEATRRHAGWSMVSVGLVALAYTFFGNHLSGMFETRVFSFERLVTYNYLGTGAVLGTPLYVAATIVTAFILFGQLLFLVGGGDAISNLAFAMMGRRRGGPAKVAIMSSALFGSLSGSASANVATTGMLTIPMMRKVGYTDRKSAAIEAVSSTGGLVLPPVMAATGFLMAEFLGMPYSEVAIAAAIPALLFYLCVYVQVDLEAAKSGITGWKDNLPDLKSSLIGIIPVALSFGVLLYTLFGMLWSPEAAAFVATFSTVIISLTLRNMRLPLKRYFQVLATAGEAIIFIAVMCAVAGLVVGCLGLTGLGSSLSQNLVALAGGNVFLLLLFAALGCIILGMGVPVTATYIILVILVGPALVEVGVSELAAHMFVFYFGTLSFLTPPVCLAVFVASSIAQSSPMPTAVYALRFAIIAYLIPFAFVFNDAFLFQGDVNSIANAIVGGVAGVFLLSIGLVGFFMSRLSSLLRIATIVTGLFAIWFGAATWFYAIAAVAVLIGVYLVQRQRVQLSSSA
ncbi:TRAP transporter permease [Chromohalobacter israelensis]|uniref:TRAP transporter permease n=1 Tax=Chromohalobacter israelensis TaxID=141390 RepID=UPI001CC642EE|nr:TRAP transporter fused permease subunit [Chromohalobacter salexigens]MBZ5876216.1 TRAP transporter fused permease subunit [Chromohalobacter salexigens]